MTTVVAALLTRILQNTERKHDSGRNSTWIRDHSLHCTMVATRPDVRETQDGIAEPSGADTRLACDIRQPCGAGETGYDNAGICRDRENLDLQGRCVLLVGGGAGLSQHFRELIEHNDGRFLHHDGRHERDHRRLRVILPKADMIFCTVDCVNHEVLIRIKLFCTHQMTRLVFLHRSSLVDFSWCLRVAAS